jgi:aerobic C4-dicarboxylate transport protein
MSRIANNGRPRKPFYTVLYVQVLAAIAVAIALGHFWPSLAVDMKPFGDGFIKLIKMVIALAIFCTVVTGIAGMSDMKKVGRVGGKALLYFEVVSILALLIGLSRNTPARRRSKPLRNSCSTSSRIQSPTPSGAAISCRSC